MCENCDQEKLKKELEEALRREQAIKTETHINKMKRRFGFYLIVPCVPLFIFNLFFDNYLAFDLAVIFLIAGMIMLVVWGNK